MDNYRAMTTEKFALSEGENLVEQEQKNQKSCWCIVIYNPIPSAEIIKGNIIFTFLQNHYFIVFSLFYFVIRSHFLVIRLTIQI